MSRLLHSLGRIGVQRNVNAVSVDEGRRGFSLLELLLAMTILLLAAMVAFPLLGYSLKRWRSRQFSRSVLSAHRAARIHAMERRRRIQVRYHLDRELIRFWTCNHPDSEGVCERDDWVPFETLPPLRADPERVDIWSVGRLRSGQACLVFTPSGYVYPPRRAPPGSRRCEGTAVGSGVHVTWKPPPTGGGSFSPCDWQTIYTPGIGNGRSFLLSYGAYPTEPAGASRGQPADSPPTVSFHRWTMGNPPGCAYRRGEPPRRRTGKG